MQYSTIFVTLASLQLEKLVEFYTSVLGQAPATYLPDRYAEFHYFGLRLGIFQPKETHRSEFAASSSGGMSLCIEVENLEAAIAHLIHLGYPPSREKTIASHGKEIYAYDPDGNRLILHESEKHF